MGGEFTGKITDIGGKFGFIKCQKLKQQGYTDDVFVLQHELRPFEKDQVVKFTAQVDSQGRPRAKDLQPIGAAPQKPPQEAPTASPDADAQFQANLAATILKLFPNIEGI